MFIFEGRDSILSYHSYKMNVKTNMLEVYVDFVDSTKDQNMYFEIIYVSFVFIVSLFLFLLLFYYLNE